MLVQDIPESCLKTSRSDVASHPGVAERPSPACGHVTDPIADHRRGDREPTRRPRRRPVRRLPVLALRAPGPLQGRGRGRLRAPLPASQDRPDRDPAEVVDLIVEFREKLTATGLDAGPDTIGWHLTHHHGVTVSRATIARYLTKAGLVVPEPKKKPKSSYIRFAAAMPNETWQADFTHYRLTRPDGRPGADTEILTWLDDCSRFALSVTAHHRVTGPSCCQRSAKPLLSTGFPPPR